MNTTGVYLFNYQRNHESMGMAEQFLKGGNNTTRTPTRRSWSQEGARTWVYSKCNQHTTDQPKMQFHDKFHSSKDKSLLFRFRRDKSQEHQVLGKDPTVDLHDPMDLHNYEADKFLLIQILIKTTLQRQDVNE